MTRRLELSKNHRKSHQLAIFQACQRQNYQPFAVETTFVCQRKWLQRWTNFQQNNANTNAKIIHRTPADVSPEQLWWNRTKSTFTQQWTRSCMCFHFDAIRPITCQTTNLNKHLQTLTTWKTCQFCPCFVSRLPTHQSRHYALCFGVTWFSPNACPGLFYQLGKNFQAVWWVYFSHTSETG